MGARATGLIGAKVMARSRHAEIAGAGFAGLVAANALAERGWTVRVHERTPSLRAEGYAISVQPNMMKVLETLGLLDSVLDGGLRIVRREVRDGGNRLTMTAHGGSLRVSRAHLNAVLAARAEQLGVEIVTGSRAAGAEPDGTLVLADGTRRGADLVVAADGVESAIRNSLGLMRSRRLMPDGAFRVMISRTASEVRDEADLGPMTTEHWSGKRRVISSPCDAHQLYLALTCMAADDAGRAIPIQAEAWRCSFPHLGELFDRIEREADWSRVAWVRFQTIVLNRWSAGRIALVGDAAHAMPPNLGQGGGCAMMNALALAVALDEQGSVEQALALWERRERPLIEHTQRWSRLYGRLALWPDTLRSAAFGAFDRIGFLQARYQRTARHVPTGYRPAASPRTVPTGR